MIEKNQETKAKKIIIDFVRKAPEITEKIMKSLCFSGISPEAGGRALAELAQDGLVLLIQIKPGTPQFHEFLAAYVPNYPGDPIPVIGHKAMRQYHGQEVPGKLIVDGESVVDDLRGLTPPEVRPGNFSASFEYGLTKGEKSLFYVRARDSKTREPVGVDLLMTHEQAVAMAKSILAFLAPPVPFADPVAPFDPSQN